MANEAREWAIKIGKDVKRLRREAGLNQNELAEKAGISKGTVSNLEMNNGSVGIEGWVGCLLALGSTPPLFFGAAPEGRRRSRTDQNLHDQLDELLAGSAEGRHAAGLVLKIAWGQYVKGRDRT